VQPTEAQPGTPESGTAESGTVEPGNAESADVTSTAAQPANADSTAARSTAAQTAAAPPSRGTRSPRDMALSMAALLVPIFLLLIGYRFLGGESPTVWDPKPTVATARDAGFPVVEPGDPSGWTPASSQFTPGAEATLRIGYRGPGRATAQLIESVQPAATLVPKELGAGAKQVGAIEITGRDWLRYQSQSRRALVLDEPGRTIVVFAAASDAQLAGFTESLRF